MKKVTLSLLLAAIAPFAMAQGVSTVHENFDVDCVLSNPIPYTSGWQEYTPTYSAPADTGRWMCTPTSGRPNDVGLPTPGIMCSGVYGNTYNKDTSFLLTPLINIIGATGHVYLNFDTKTTNIHLGGAFDVLLLPDSVAYDTTLRATDVLTTTMVPLIGPGDSSGWVTHELEITAYKSTPFYVIFRYTSSTSTGNTWYLDNVNTSATRLNVPNIDNSDMPLTVIGNSSANNISLSYTTETPGNYYLAISDLMGRVVYRTTVFAGSGTQAYNVTGLELHPGMYFVKMGNGNVQGTAKAMVY